MTANRIEALGQGTWLIEESAFGSSVYMYLLSGTKQAMLIDSGLMNLPLQETIASLTDLPVIVVNTHGHLDHISGNHQFDTAYLHPDDEAVFMEHSDDQSRRAYCKAILAEKGQSEEEIHEYLSSPQVETMCNLPQRNNRHPLHEGMVLDLGERPIQVIETPGHTRGSVCLLDISRQWLFSGDTVCDQGVLLHLPHSTPVSVFAHSLSKLQARREDYSLLYPSHHRYPLQPEILDRYQACAGRIIQGETGIVIGSALGAAQILQHEGISLTFPVEA